MDFSSVNIKGEVPLREILQDSAYYPGSGDDGFPMKVCNTKWSDLGINSFVYCDFGFSRKEIKRGALGVIAGYNLVGERWLEPEEYIPQEWRLNLYGATTEKYRDRRFANDAEVEHFAVWRIYKRTIHKDDSHGPEILSFLFVNGEGFASYQQLYCWNKVSPKLIFFIQYWDMCAPKDDFESTQSAFFRMIKANHECAPEWVSCGHHDAVRFALRVWNLSKLGLKMVGYKSTEEVNNLIGEEASQEQIDCPILYHNARKVSSGNRVYLLIKYCNDTIVYEIIDKNRSCEEVLSQIVKAGDSQCRSGWQ